MGHKDSSINTPGTPGFVRNGASAAPGRSIAWKIGAGFGVLVLLLAVVGGVSFNGIGTADSGFQEYRALARGANESGRVQANMLMVRMHAKDFIIRGRESSVINLEQRYEALTGYIGDATDVMLSDQDRQTMGVIKKDAEQYKASFDQVVALMGQRNDLVNNGINQSGPQIRKKLAEIMESAYQDGDAAASYRGGTAISSLMLARLYAAKFLVDNDHADVDRVHSEFADLQIQLDALDAELQNPARRALLAEAQELTDAYKRDFDEIVSVIETRNGVITGTLDVLGPQIAAAVEDIKLNAKTRQDELGPSLVALNARTNQIVIGTTLIAALVGVGVAVFITRGITGPIKTLLASFQKIAAGDLRERVSLKSNDEIGQLGRGFNAFVERLGTVIREVAESASLVSTSSSEIASASEQMSTGLGEQEQQAKRSTAAVSEMMLAVRESAEQSASTATVAQEAGEKAAEGGAIVQNTVDGMSAIADVVRETAASIQQLGERGEQIGQVIQVINDIADQTNLLALNAAIEAARAGEHGRGFAVVADEVRKLADRTTNATQEIASSIQAIQVDTGRAVERTEAGTARVEEGLTLANQAGEALDSIVTGTERLASGIQAIAAAAEEQSHSATEIGTNVENISTVILESSESARRAAEIAHELRTRSQALDELVEQFSY